MAESEGELKSLLMKVKEESEESWLKTKYSKDEDHGIYVTRCCSALYGFSVTHSPDLDLEKMSIC